MVAGWILLLVSAAYAGLLFAVAWWGDRRPLYPTRTWLRPAVYSLALAVYCSSWTFYGAVGTAASTGLGFLPIYLGPALLMVFAWKLLERLVLITGEQRVVSIADFIGARYGRAQSLAALVTCIALVAAVPYIALQFKAVALSVEVVAGEPAGSGVLQDPAFWVAAMLAAFAIAFGTRGIDATEHHHGMMLAVALESLVKLVAFVAVGVYAWTLLPEGSGERLAAGARTLVDEGLPRGFLAQTLLAFAAIVCLPRQFQVAVVECEDVGDVRRSRWWFVGYLALICAMVVPITLAGHALIGPGGAPADTWVLQLPAMHDASALTLLVYVGGFSAATGMVIVACVALATMVSNDLVMPLLLRTRRYGQGERRPVGPVVLWVRRATIVLLCALAYGYYRGSTGADALAVYGLLAFAAVAQFAPALIGGLYWRGASRQGAQAALLAGFATWTYTLLLPSLAASGWLPAGWVASGPLGIEWLRPQALFGLRGWDALTHGVFWSLLVNVGAFLVVSARSRPSFEERLRAAPFLDPYAQRQPYAGSAWQGSILVGDLQALAARVVGVRQARRAFLEHMLAQGRELPPTAPADRALLVFCERLLAASIGAASARRALTGALRGTGMELAEVIALLDEAGQELRFNRQILSATLDNLSQAVSVVDGEMRLVAWNRRYQEMFEYPEGMLYIGRPVADLIRYNAERGELGEAGQDDDIAQKVARRIGHMRAGSPHVFERVRPNGQVIEMTGRALPGGGYVTTYTDVTDYKRVERALRESNETLEARVAERSAAAEAANRSRTRFLAALSHDVLQPLNAARLFASALGASDDAAEQKRLAERVDTALRAAEELLDGLLDVSRLEEGALLPEREVIDLDALLASVAGQYAPLAQARGLRLRLARSGLRIRSDRRLLRRVIQNYLANALRYTREGQVLVGARRVGDSARIEVWDTGPGIPPEHLAQIYEEFHRYEQPSPWGERGLGLGLSICQRISRLLGHPIAVRSWPGRGSVFSIAVPRSDEAPAAPATLAPGDAGELAGLQVLCVDNDREILDGMAALLGRWGVGVRVAETVDEALAAIDAARPDALVVDYHLHDRLDGLQALDALRARAGGPPLPAALATADGGDALKRRAREGGYPVLTKPLKPAVLRAFLGACRRAPAATP